MGGAFEVPNDRFLNSKLSVKPTFTPSVHIKFILACEIFNVNPGYCG